MSNSMMNVQVGASTKGSAGHAAPLFQMQGSNLSVVHMFVNAMVTHDGDSVVQAQGCRSVPRALQAFSTYSLSLLQHVACLDEAGVAVAKCDVSGTAALLKLGFWTCAAASGLGPSCLHFSDCAGAINAGSLQWAQCAG